jgi:hypothetical protein
VSFTFWIGPERHTDTTGHLGSRACSMYLYYGNRYCILYRQTPKPPNAALTFSSTTDLLEVYICITSDEDLPAVEVSQVEASELGSQRATVYHRRSINALT